MSARLLFLPFLLVLVLSGCATKPRNVVQLMPDPDGHVGQVVVTNPAGSAQLVQAGCAVRVADAKSAPTAPEVLTEAESEALFGAVRRALPEKPVRFILYFDSETTRLTTESQTLVPKVLATAKERDSRDIAVVGHASAAGDANYNIEISRKRAESVRKLLVKAGLPPEGIEVASHGSANPLVISSNPHEPKNRRVEITVR